LLNHRGPFEWGPADHSTSVPVITERINPRFKSRTSEPSNPETTGVDLSKILGGQTKMFGGKMVKNDKCMGVYQLLGGTCPGCPQSLRLCRKRTGIYVSEVHLTTEGNNNSKAMDIH